MSLNDDIQNRVIRHMVYLESLKNRESRKVLKVLDNEIIPDLKDKIAIRIGRLERFGFDRGIETTKRLEAMLAEFDFVSGHFKNLRNVAEPTILKVGKDEADFMRGMIQEESPVVLGLGSVNADQIKRVVLTKPFDGRTLKQWWDSLEDSTIQRINTDIRRGVIEGETTQQIVRRLNPALDITRRQTETVVRTAIQHSMNEGRTQFYSENVDVIKGVKWVATLDGRTSPICQSRDGRVYEIGNAPAIPAHPNCRSSLSPVTKSWKELGIKLDEAPDGTRASMNGQVPKDITYNQWLKSQPVEFQEEVLGKTKAKLFRDGGLPVDKFVNRSGNELTLKQLRKREAGAFEKIGL